MRVDTLLAACADDEAHSQRYTNQFIDDLRRVPAASLLMELGPGPSESGRYEGLISAIVDAVCRERGLRPPRWVQTIGSPTPFFVLPARGFALRVRLMIESPPAFRIRNVFVPENYLSRA
jgi:hypothetical protein